MQNTNEKKDLKKTNVYRIFIELVAVGSVTGVVVGIIVTFFNILMHVGEEISYDEFGNPIIDTTGAEDETTAAIDDTTAAADAETTEATSATE
jgi:hypothetical protein